MAKRIMVVEDNDLNRKLFCDVLKANGFEVEPVAEGDKVLATARAAMPDLIIMDIQLPEISGLELTDRLKKDETMKHIPIVAVTAFAMRGDEQKIMAAGCDAYLSKPISVTTFLETIRKFIG